MALFYEDRDYREFLLFLREALILSGCLLFGYALMGNHYHLVLRGSQEQISQCMQRLNWRYALFHNDMHQMGGHVFDGPYQAYPQRSLRWLLWRLAYVFLNPVQGGLCDRPEDYPWSGYQSFMGRPGSPLELSPLPELALIDPDLEKAKKFFLSLLEEQRLAGPRRSGTPTARDIQLDQFEWIRRQASVRAQTVPVDPLSLALWWGREHGIPPRVMAQALGWPSGEQARARVRAFQKALEADPALAQRLAL